MQHNIRVLVVDDSAFMRRVISDMINAQPDMEVIDTARDGEIAIAKVQALNPDVITLDVEMPKKNGLEALKEIKRVSSCEAIMLSSLTSEGSAITIDALRFGAFDFIQKPSGSISLDIDKVKDELVEKIRYANAHVKRRRGLTGTANIVKTAVQPIRQTPEKKPQGRIDALLLGASTGGPRVLYDVITKLPGDLGIPVFVVQHMPAGFTKAFAERIDKGSALSVIEASNGCIIKPNVVYVAPGGYHMLINKNNILLDLSPSVHGVRPAVDKLFISAIDTYHGNILSCIFTGMGRDGAEGSRLIKSKGGYVMAQDEATSTVYGMPRAVYETGCVDLVLPDYKIPERIIQVVRGK